MWQAKNQIGVGLWAHRLLPEHDLLLSVRDEGHPAVVRDDDRQTLRMNLSEAICSAMTCADVLHVIGLSFQTFGIERAPYASGRGQLGRHFSSKAKESQSLVEN